MYQEPWYLNLFNDEILKRAKESFDILKDILKKQQDGTNVRVSYNGFTGELVKLERSTSGKFKFPVGLTETENIEFECLYDLFIYDSKNQVTHSFSGVKMEDMEFMGGVVSFGG